jgi:methionyl-tRNA synthetase
LITPHSQDDLNFDWEEFSARINSELIGNLGNFVNRALGFTQKSVNGIVPQTEEFDSADTEVQNKIKNLVNDMTSLMEQNDLDKALKRILEFSAHFNQYFQQKEPWKGAKGTNNCIYLSVNAVRSIAIALFPFLPESSEKIWVQLNLTGKVSEQKWNSMSDLAVCANHKIGASSPLFKKVEMTDIEKHKAKLGA